MNFDWNARVRVEMRDGQVMDDTNQIYYVRDAITAVPWITARQYPPPHQYVIVGRCPPLAWDVLACAIAKHPESCLAYFRGYQKPMRYWEFESYRYWRTASRNPSGKIIHMLNRCALMMLSHLAEWIRVRSPDWTGMAHRGCRRDLSGQTGSSKSQMGNIATVQN